MPHCQSTFCLCQKLERWISQSLNKNDKDTLNFEPYQETCFQQNLRNYSDSNRSDINQAKSLTKKNQIKNKPSCQSKADWFKRSFENRMMKYNHIQSKIKASFTNQKKSDQQLPQRALSKKVKLDQRYWTSNLEESNSLWTQNFLQYKINLNKRINIKKEEESMIQMENKIEAILDDSSNNGQLSQSPSLNFQNQEESLKVSMEDIQEKVNEIKRRIQMSLQNEKIDHNMYLPQDQIEPSEPIVERLSIVYNNLSVCQQSQQNSCAVQQDKDQYHDVKQSPIEWAESLKREIQQVAQKFTLQLQKQSHYKHQEPAEPNNENLNCSNLQIQSSSYPTKKILKSKPISAPLNILTRSKQSKLHLYNKFSFRLLRKQFGSELTYQQLADRVLERDEEKLMGMLEHSILQETQLSKQQKRNLLIKHFKNEEFGLDTQQSKIRAVR